MGSYMDTQNPQPIIQPPDSPSGLPTGVEHHVDPTTPTHQDTPLADSGNAQTENINPGQVNKAANLSIINKMSYFMFGLLGPIFILGIIIATGTTWHIINMPTNLFIFNMALMFITNILAIIYFKKRNKPRLKYLSWGILVGLIIGVVYFVGA